MNCNMNEREAIEVLKLSYLKITKIDRVIYNTESQKITAITMAIEALEKQMPKPIKWLCKDKPLCPCCIEIVDNNADICKCGQRLKWEEVKDE